MQSQVRELHKACNSSHTTTMMLLGIPNVGKSALSNSLHQIGRISAAGKSYLIKDCCVFSGVSVFPWLILTCSFTEKGKLKHTTVSPQPGDTKDIMSLKVCSLPLSKYLRLSPLRVLAFLFVWRLNFSMLREFICFRSVAIPTFMYWTRLEFFLLICMTLRSAQNWHWQVWSAPNTNGLIIYSRKGFAFSLFSFPDSAKNLSGFLSLM